MRVAGMLLPLAVVLASQLPGQNRRLIGTLREDLKGQQDKYNQVRVQEQRLLDLRIRHDMGLPVRAGRYLKMTEEQANLVRYADPAMLPQEEEKARKLARQLAALQDRFEAVSGGTPAPITEPVPLPSIVAIGKPVNRPLPVREVARQAETTPARPAGETRPLELTEDLGETSGEVNLLKGSVDAANIGRVLLRYGDALLSRAETLEGSGSTEEAKRYRDRAQKEWQRAKQELSPLVWTLGKGKLARELRDDVSLENIFILAQCEEKLGNVGPAEDLYSRIITRDSVNPDAGPQTLGPWGSAAELANEVMNFMIDHGNFKTVPPVSSLKWQGK